MRTLEQIRLALQDRRLGVIAAATGLHPNTIRRLRDEQDHDPAWRTVERLDHYLDSMEAKHGRSD